MKTKNKAFTLTELLITTSIIGILTAVALPNFLNARIRGQVARSQMDQRSIATALEAYRTDNPQYPEGAVVTPDGGYIKYPRIDRLKPLTTPVSYLHEIPQDIFHPKENPAENVPTYGDKRTYLLSNMLATDPQPDVRGMIVPNFLEKRREWYLLSKGPSKERTNLGVLDSSDSYSPTNGTRSPGYLMNWGP